MLTVVVRDVGGETSDLGRSGGTGVGNGQNFSKEFGSGREVVVPAQPTTVGRIQVEGDVGELELLDRIGNTLFVRSGSISTPRDTHVGDQVCK